MNEFEIMEGRIAKVRQNIDNILKEYSQKPDIDFGWSGGSIDLYIKGGSHGARKAIENHMINSKKYTDVSLHNHDNVKHFNFYLSHGGQREGAGRPATGRKKKNFYITEEEEKKLREYLEELRKQDSK